MPLETATYVADLNTANPAATDGLNQADDHLRLIKSALKSTFPNFTSDALTATQEDLDAAATAATDGATLLADTGAHFKTNTLDGLENPSAGTVSVVASNGAGTPAKQTVVEFKGSDKSASFKGPVAATGNITGPGSCPIGSALMWFSDTLPSGHGTFAWANGAKISATTYSALAALWPDRLVDSDANIQLPDLRETVPVGKSTMGSTSARSLLSHITSSLLNTIGSLFGEGNHKLTNAELPQITPTFTGTNKTVNVASTTGFARYFNLSTTGGGGFGFAAVFEGNQTVNSTGSYKPEGTISSFGGTDKTSLVQPSTTVNWIIRIA